MRTEARVKRDQTIYELNQGHPNLSYTELARLYGLSERQVGTIIRRIRTQQEGRRSP